MADTPRVIENIIPILRVEDLATSLEYYEKVFGFPSQWSTGDFACVARDGCSLYLAEGNQGQPGTWVWIGVEDLDRMYEECKEKGAEIRSEISNHPWAREFQAADPDGHVLRFGGEPEA